MLINVYYDTPNDCDIIDLALQDFETVRILQGIFFKWLYNKDNDHEYWVYRNGQKIGCAYDTIAFINWVNKYYSSCAAQIIEQHTRAHDDYPTIYF